MKRRLNRDQEGFTLEELRASESSVGEIRVASASEELLVAQILHLLITGPRE